MLYYNNATLDSEWNTLGNWWNDAVFSDPALALPTAGDDLEIWQPVLTVNTGIGFPYALSVTVQTTGYLTQAIYNFVGGTLPYGISFFGVSGWVTDTYYVAGRPSTLPQSGTGYWFGQGYFIAGVVTLLPESGTGWDAILNDWYIAGVATGLDANGSGFYLGHAYYYGTAQPTGWNDYHYYVNDAQTALDSGGTGEDGGLYYSAYPTLAEGWQDYGLGNDWYIAGVATGLDSGGSGVYLYHAYYLGALQPTGWNGLFFYINDAETTLDLSGNGVWETRNYVGGVSLGEPGTDKRWLIFTNSDSSYDASITANWNSVSTDWEGGTNTVAGAAPTAVDSCLINDVNPSSGGLTCDHLQVTTNGASYEYAYGILSVSCVTATITGVNRMDITASTSITFTGSGINYGTLSGTTHFYGSSHNDWTTAVVGFTTNFYYGTCSSGATFHDTSYNGGQIDAPVVATYSGIAYVAVVSGTATFRDSSYNLGKCTDAVFYDSAKNMLGIQGTSTLSYSKGINGTGILGIL